MASSDDFSPSGQRVDEFLQIDDEVIKKFSGWFNEFYSNPENCLAYAAWCKENGLENDLSAPTWRDVSDLAQLTTEEPE